MIVLGKDIDIGYCSSTESLSIQQLEGEVSTWVPRCMEKLRRIGSKRLRLAVLKFLESVIILDAAIAQVVAERLNGQPVLFRDCSVKLEEQVQMAERASEYFNFMARSEGTTEIDLAELRESLQPEIDRQISIWFSLARLETVSAFGNLADVHATRNTKCPEDRMNVLLSLFKP